MIKTVKVFTDGSSTVYKDNKNLRYGGIGVYLSQYSKYNVSKGVSGENVTNQRCELQACIDAIKNIKIMKKIVISRVIGK